MTEGMKPHIHHRDDHNEFDNKKGATKLSSKEKKMVDRIQKQWNNKKEKK